MMKSKNICIWMILFLFSILILSGCEKEPSFHINVESPEEQEEDEEIEKTQWEKGYDLPIEKSEKEEAQADCEKVMKLIQDIYKKADKGEASNVVISEETMFQMKEVIKEAGNPVISTATYASMDHYEKMNTFLLDCNEGKRGSVILYEIYSNGGIGRLKFTFDGEDLYVLTATSRWDKGSKPTEGYLSYTRIKEWTYTERGWLCYRLCVPESPEVNGVVDGSCLVRVKPFSKELLEYTKKYVFPIGYQGNNLLCSDWNEENVDGLDYTGLYEYFYALKYGRLLYPESYPEGIIPKEEFEKLIMEYLPVSAEQIRKTAEYDEERQGYLWEKLGCATYAPTAFGTSLPEVVQMEDHGDGTITLTVDAVCEKDLCSDSVITHKLTIRLLENGSFQYIGNEILNDGLQKIPEYQYRLEYRGL